MFATTVEEFLVKQKSKLSEEKVKHLHKLQNENNDTEAEEPVREKQMVNSEDKENVPFSNKSSHLLRNVKSCTARKVLASLEQMLDDKKSTKLAAIGQNPEHDKNVNSEEITVQNNKSFSELVSYWTNLRKRKPDVLDVNLAETIKQKRGARTVKKLISDLENMVIKREQKLHSFENAENKFGNESKMLRFGEYSPNNPKMRVSTQPYLGLGEYEQTRPLLEQQRKNDYQHYAEKLKYSAEREHKFLHNNFKDSVVVSSCVEKAVQTDIQDINSKLVQYDYQPSYTKDALENLPRNRGMQMQIDNAQIETQNNLISVRNKYGGMDVVDMKRNNSPNRAKLLADLQSSYFPTIMGNVATNTDDEEKAEKIRRQEKYLIELRQQIEEKEQLAAKHREQERLEQELALKRFDLQLRDKQIADKYLYNTDVPIRAFEHDQKFDQTYVKNKSRVLESSLTQYSDPTENRLILKSTKTNSPPLSRCEKRPPYSFNIPSTSIFANSVPVKDSAEKKLVYDEKRRNSAKKFDDTLPIPVLRVQSPVAKELKNAVAVQSRSSDVMRKLEDKWQIPAVQKNILQKSWLGSEGNSEQQSILTQLGAIRLQLQQEQLRLDETLRKRGTSNTAIVQADVHPQPYSK